MAGKEENGPRSAPSRRPEGVSYYLSLFSLTLSFFFLNDDILSVFLF